MIDTTQPTVTAGLVAALFAVIRWADRAIEKRRNNDSSPRIHRLERRIERLEESFFSITPGQPDLLERVERLERAQ